jgi:hypothetical protein
MPDAQQVDDIPLRVEGVDNAIEHFLFR